MTQISRRLILMGILLSSAGPFQFGYLASVFNQPEELLGNFIKNSHWQQYGDWLDDNEIDLIWATTIAMLLAGMLISGIFITRPSLDGLGRKKSMYIMVGFIACGNVVQALSYAAFLYQLLAVGRLISGIGCALGCVGVPIFLSEIAPREVRGTMCSFAHFGFAVGALFANIFALPSCLGGLSSWPWLLVIPLVPPVILGLVLPWWCPESPKYLFTRLRRSDLAADSISWYHGEYADLGTSLQILNREHELGQLGFKSLVKDTRLRTMLYIIFAVAVGGTFDGTLALYSYMTALVKQIAGILEAQVMSFLYPISDLIFGIPAFYLMDMWGRRPLLLFGFWGVSSCLLALFFGTLLSKITGSYFFAVISLAAIQLHVIVRTFGYSKIIWMLETELFPTQARSVASSVRSVLMDFFNMLILFGFLPIFNSIGAFVFVFLLVPVVLAAIYVTKFCPETAIRAVADIVSSITGPPAGRKPEEDDFDRPNDFYEDFQMDYKVPDSGGRSPLSPRADGAQTYQTF